MSISITPALTLLVEKFTLGPIEGMIMVSYTIKKLIADFVLEVHIHEFLCSESMWLLI